MPQRRVILNSDETAALTRLVIGFCLGKGSLCLYSRSYVLQIAQPKLLGAYSRYQWDRLRQFLPSALPPRYFRIEDPRLKSESGQWRLRTSSLYFETAHRLLYPQGDFSLTSAVLELVGAEAIANLWADRGRILRTRQANFCSGQLNLSKCDWESAELVRQWIQTLTGAESRLHHSPRKREAPMLYFDHDNTLLLMQRLHRTWMATAECLNRKFQPPGGDGNEAERFSADMLLPRTVLPAAPSRRASKPARQLPPRPGVLTPPELPIT